MKKYLLILFLLVPFASSDALDLSEIRDQVRIRVKDSHATNRRYSDAQLNALINETHREVISATWVIKKSTEIELTVDTTYYTLPTDTIHIFRVTLRDLAIPETSLSQLDSQGSGRSFTKWETASGLPQKYFQDPAQPNSIGVYPWPDTSSSTGTLRVQYYAEANELSSDTDEPFNSDSRYETYHDVLIYDPVYKIYLLEGNVQKAEFYKARFEDRMGLMIQRIHLKENYRPSFGAQRQ